MCFIRAAISFQIVTSRRCDAQVMIKGNPIQKEGGSSAKSVLTQDETSFSFITSTSISHCDSMNHGHLPSNSAIRDSPEMTASRKRPRKASVIAGDAVAGGSVPQCIPKVKSCVECRQQKVRPHSCHVIHCTCLVEYSLNLLQIKCDVVKEPFAACSNCTRLGKHCEIDQDFKRIAKREYASYMLIRCFGDR
jgi:hypothetical protein